MLKKLLILFILFSISCQSQQEEIESKLKNCVTQGLKELRPESTDFYSLMSSLEDKMIEKGMLKDKSKEDYLKLFNSIEAESKATKEFYEENIQYLNEKFPFGLFLANDLIFNQCPFKVYSQNKKENMKIYNIGKLQNQVMENGFNIIDFNKKLIQEFSDSDFNKIIYRAPIIQLVLINMDLQYDLDLKKFEEYKKNRTFLNRN